MLFSLIQSLHRPTLLLNAPLQINITPNSLRLLVIDGGVCTATALRLSKTRGISILDYFGFNMVKFPPMGLCPKLSFSRHFEEIVSTIFA